VLALLALASSAVWGTSDFLGGLVTRRRPAIAVVGVSQALALVVLTVVVVARGEVGIGAWWPPAVAAGLTGTTALVSFYAALSTGTMGVVSPIAALGVVVPVGVGYLTGERPGGIAWVGVVVAVVGVVLASGPELSGGASRRPIGLALVAAVGFGATLVLLDRGASVSLLHTLWGMRLTSATVFLAVALVARSVGGVGSRDLPLLLLIGCGDVLANGLYAFASSNGLVSLASVLGSLFPAVTVVLARFVLHERLRRVQQAGIAGCLVGSALIALA
jgi:drug/metabolite transporter (DMT)-like permease